MHCDTDRKIPGSRGPASYNIWKIADPAPGRPAVYDSNVCPLPGVDAGIWSLFRLYRLFEKGNLLVSGGVLEQPNIYLEAMNEIEQALKNG